MLLFRDKGKNKKKDNTHVNIDNKHKEIMKLFENQKQELDELHKTYYLKKQLYDELEKIPNNIINDEQIEMKFQLKIELECFEKNINMILNENNRTN